MNVVMNPDRTTALQSRQETQGAAFALARQQEAKQVQQSEEAEIEIMPLIPMEDPSQEVELGPDAWVVGVTQGPATRRGLESLATEALAGSGIGPGGAAFATIPTNGGTPSLFVAQPLRPFPCGPLNCSIGLVSTIRPELGSPDDAEGAEGVRLSRPDLTIEGGVGGTVSAKINGMTVLGFFNLRSSDGVTQDALEQFARGEISEVPPGTYSMNFGVAGSAMQPVEVALRELGRVASAVPKPTVAALGQGMMRGSQILELANDFFDVKVGAGFRLALVVDENGEMTFMKGSQEIDLEQAILNAFSPNRLPEIPILENPDNDESIENVNITSRLINGANPFELARSLGGETYGNSVIELASQINRFTQEVAMPIAYMLPPDVQSIIAHGIRNYEDFGAVYDAVHVLNHIHGIEVPGFTDNRFGNLYDLDFGSQVISHENSAQFFGFAGEGWQDMPPEHLRALGMREEDHEFVRNVFQGTYRDPVDMRQPFEETMPQ